MLESLRIERLAVVDSVEIELGPGLNVLTGETGAGKSIILSALGLLAGGRASGETIRAGADDALVEAVFSTADLADVKEALAERGFEADEDSLVVRRQLARSGRHRARVAGETVPAGLLGELFSGRLEISSQHASQALLRPEAQSRLLDEFGGLLTSRQRVAEAYARVKDLDERAHALRAAAEERARREDFLSFQVEEIDAVALEEGEWEGLVSERARLGHADQLGLGVREAVVALSGDPGAADAPGAADWTARAGRAVEGLAALDASLEPFAERLQAAAEEIADLAAELERYGDGVEADPARLAEVEERLARIERLKRKYGEDVAQVLAFREQAAEELASLRGAEAGLSKLDAERAEARAELSRAARELTAGRTKAAAKLSRAAQKGIRSLALEQARFQVELEPAAGPDDLPSGPNGAETAAFRFAADPGTELRDLRRVASGGELSRVFLALKNVLRPFGAGMVLVFDEVDAGIGGAVADRVGASLAELAEEHQVLCITHLPQVAARAAHHFRVHKATEKGRAVTRVDPLGDSARVDEIARMAGGAQITAATRKHAQELLAAGR